MDTIPFNLNQHIADVRMLDQLQANHPLTEAARREVKTALQRMLLAGEQLSTCQAKAEAAERNAPENAEGCKTAELLRGTGR
jgi:hypothetical protein